jgi:hypothetical protein
MYSTMSAATRMTTITDETTHDGTMKDHDHTNENEDDEDVVKTVFKIQSQNKHDRSLPGTIIPISILVVCLSYYDPYIEMDLVWVVSGTIIALYIFETSSSTRHVEVIVTICPMGIQRTMYTHHHRLVQHYPILPKEIIQDCFVAEHVNAFSVTSHVMLRTLLPSSSSSSPSSTTTTTVDDDDDSGRSVPLQLYPAFPKVTLSFGQCYVLMKQIRRALVEV